MKKRKFILISLLFAFIAVFACACASVKGTLIEFDGTYRFAYTPAMSTSCDEDMKIDGVLDESRYEGLKAYEHTQNGVSIRVVTSFSEKGAYIGATAIDPHYVYVKRMNYYKNSCFWLSIKAKDVTYDVGNACFNYYIDGKNAWNFNGKGFLADSTVTENDEGSVLTAELFIAWKDLNIDVSAGLPDCIRINPSYRSYDGIGTYNWITGMFFFTDRDRQECSGRFGADGYINADTENSEVGNAANGYAKSDGWDLSEVGNGIVKSDVDHSQGIFLKNIYSEAYVYSVSVEIGDDIYGKSPSGAGVMNAVSQIECSAFYLNGTSMREKSKAEYNTLGFYKNGAYSWVYNAGGYITPDYDSYGGKVKYTVLKDGGAFYYIVNGKFVMSEYVEYLQGASCPGFFALDSAAVFSDYSARDLSGNRGEIDEILKTYGVYRINVASSTGGTAETSAYAVEEGESFTLTIRSAGRHVLSSLTAADGAGTVTDLYDYAAKNMKNGKLTIENVRSSLTVTPGFTRLSDTVKISGKIRTDEGKWLAGAEVTLKSENNNLLYYAMQSAANGDYAFYVPAEGSFVIGDRTVECNGTYRLGVKCGGYLPVYDTINVNGAAEKDYTLQRPEYSIESYGIIEDNGVYSAADELSSRTADYKLFETENAQIALLQAKIVLPENGTLTNGQSVGFTFTDGSKLAEDKIDTQSKVREKGNYHTREIGLAGSGVFLSSYMIGCKSRYPGVWGAGTFSELQYDKDNSSLWSETNERTLSLALYKDVLYVWIDETFVISLSTTDTNYFADPVITAGGGYRFGVFFMATGSKEISAEVTENYGDDALAILSDENGIYRDEIFPAPAESESITFADGVYMVDSLSFRQSGYAYTSPAIYAKTAVYSVKIHVDNVAENAEIDGFSDWTTNIGVTVSNGAVITSSVAGRSDTLNRFYSVQLGLNKYGAISTVASCLALASRLDTGDVYAEKTIVEKNKLVAGKDKILTVILYNGALYMFADDLYVTSLPVTYARFAVDGYSFGEDDGFKFGVNVTNLDTTKNKAAVTVVTEKYEAEALAEIRNNVIYSTRVLAKTVNDMSKAGNTYTTLRTGWAATSYYFDSLTYVDCAVYSVKIKNTEAISSISGSENFAGICFTDGTIMPADKVYRDNAAGTLYACEIGFRNTTYNSLVLGRTLTPQSSQNGRDCLGVYGASSTASANGEVTLTVVYQSDMINVYVNGEKKYSVSVTDEKFSATGSVSGTTYKFNAGAKLAFGVMSFNQSGNLSFEVLTELYGEAAASHIAENYTESV